MATNILFPEKTPSFIETYNGVEIWEESFNPIYPFTTKEHNIPILGTMEHGHKSLEAAKEYIDKTRK